MLSIKIVNLASHTIKEVSLVVRKTCPGCRRNSYSATESGRWLCPYCGEDISEMPVEPAVSSARKKEAETMIESFVDTFCP